AGHIQNDDGYPDPTKPPPANDEIPVIKDQISLLKESGNIDSFLLYLYGVVLSRQNERRKAAEILVESINQFPYNWSAWLAFIECVDGNEVK
ncbi:anaphase-promoting complex component apc8, partial [Nowakowskiella sp. JEL0078]